MKFITSEYQDCIDFLNDCGQVCNECFDSSLHSSDLPQRGQLIKSLVECAKQCELTVGFLARNSIHAKEMALLSAHIAKTTAELCEEFTDEQTIITGQVCLETASICVENFNK